MNTRPEMLFVHEKKAAYPELVAYRRYFEGRFEVREISPSESKILRPTGATVVWRIMGVHRHSVNADFLVHDYRSLSTPPFSCFKDRVKKFVNVKPNLRIFQNKAMESAMRFNDNVPSVLLPMGVPDSLISKNIEAVPCKWDYVYIGEINRDRGMHNVLRSFSVNMSGRKKLVLVGNYEKAIYNEFSSIPGVDFTGRLSQEDALNVVRESEVAVCQFPNHWPHNIQTPTKLLEYASLGKRIVANKSASVEAACSELGIHVHYAGSDFFRDLPDPEEIKDNTHFDSRSIGWTNTIKNSGIDQHFDKILARPKR